jgi:pyruvate dehydrogenase kinase 2/3/4
MFTVRISDQGGGIPREILPYLWSFSKGPRTQTRLENLAWGDPSPDGDWVVVTSRCPGILHGMNPGRYVYGPPNLRLGMGLPMSRVYAEYWAGSLELHSLEGYGVEYFL